VEKRKAIPITAWQVNELNSLSIIFGTVPHGALDAVLVIPNEVAESLDLLVIAFSNPLTFRGARLCST
jgi:hypothetical protein